MSNVTARAIRDMALRAAEHKGRPQQYAEVTNAKPLKVQLASGMALDEDDLVLGASARSYDKGVGIKRGDTLIVTQMGNDDWLAVDVVTDSEMGGVPSGGTAGQVPVKAADGSVGWQTPAAPPAITGKTYTMSGYAADRVMNASATSMNEVASVLATLIDDLKAAGLIK